MLPKRKFVSVFDSFSDFEIRSNCHSIGRSLSNGQRETLSERDGHFTGDFLARTSCQCSDFERIETVRLSWSS